MKSGIVGRTRVYCTACRTQHAATLERDGAMIVGRVACPVGERLVRLSSDADMYVTLRERAPIPHQCREHGDETIRVCYLDITNQCNMHCPVCYANAGPHRPPYDMPVEAAVQRAKRARRNGARSVTLIGGEPTVHPDLEALITALRQLGIRISMASNGLAFADDPGYAARLKRAGLTKVNIQFDTFRPAVHRALRGSDGIERKQEAARRVVAAGLNLGLTTTVTSLNVEETGDIVRFGLSLGPLLTTFTFRIATRAGRYEAADEVAHTDKERVLASLFESGAVPGANTDDFWPVPPFAPWRLHVHPDCGVCMVIEQRNDCVRRASELIDLAGLWQRMAACRARTGWLSRNLVPAYLILSATRRGNRLSLIRSFVEMIRRNPNRGFVFLAVADFPSREFCDLQRIGNCPAAVLTESGPVSPCWWYGWEQDSAGVPPPEQGLHGMPETL